VLAEFATVVTETVKAGAATVKIERYMITDAAGSGNTRASP
jgi:hypothetical protein